MELPFSVWETIDNTTLYKTFLCKNCGGMRRSHRTNTLVLISDHTKGVYADSWDYSTGMLKYVGEGQKGNQYFAGQNKVLAESRINGVELHLFEVFVPNKYLYEGIVTLEGQPYFEIHTDVDQKPRNVVIFNLKLDPANLTIMTEYLRERNQWIFRLGFADESTMKIC
jgi:5-methylcytosine-specific restriction protein A